MWEDFSRRKRVKRIEREKKKSNMLLFILTWKILYLNEEPVEYLGWSIICLNIWMIAGDEFIENDSKTVHIALFIVRLAPDNLWCHVNVSS